MRARIAVATATVAAMAAGGCTTTESGSATPGPAANTAPTTSSAEPNSGAPSVDDPLDASRYLADPCAVLAEATLATFGVSRTGKPDTTSASAEVTGPSCIWYGQEENTDIAVSWQTGNKNGLSDTYSLQEDFDTWDHFEASNVDGYPAVFNNFAVDAENGACNLVVGTSDTLAFSVLLLSGGSLDAKTSCDRVMQVATAVIQTLKESQ